MRADSFVRGSDFLSAMARTSAERVAAARRATSLAAIEERVRARAADEAPRAPSFSAAGFDVIAEVKFASPSAGDLAPSASPAAAVERARTYAAAGACAISVLTEPSRFGGSLDHLRAAAAATPTPVLRKDFLVDPYQVWEARDAGASGVLLIARLLDDEALEHMTAAARETGMFVLLEGFDEEDLERMRSFLAPRVAGGVEILAGVNGRDLVSLEVDPERHLRLAPLLPPGVPAVAESGLASPDDAERAAGAGYRLGLVGTALMRAAAPEEVLGELIAAGRRGGEARA